MITGNKDTDIIVLTKLNHENFLIFYKFRNKYINKLYKNENLWRSRLFKYYAEIYPEVGQSWKDLYLRLVVHMVKYKYRKDNDSFISAIERGHLSVVKYLMSFPKLIDPAAENNYAIRLASECGYLSIVKYLIGLPEEYGISPNAENNEAVRYSSMNGHLSVVKYLTRLPQEYGIDPTTEDNYAIRYASANGHLSVVKYLISLPNIDPTASNNYAIRYASENGHLDVVKYLMSLPEKYGINPAADDNSAIIWASRNGHLEVVKYLIGLPKEYKINPSANNNQAIKWASKYGHLDVVKYLKHGNNQKFIVSISNCGEIESKFICTEKLSNIQKFYLLECIDKIKFIEEQIDKCDKIKSLSDEEIDKMFKYMFTGGYGYQMGNPGKEWVTIDIKNLKDCKFEKLKF